MIFLWVSYVSWTFSETFFPHPLFQRSRPLLPPTVPPLPEATANALPTPKQVMLPVAGYWKVSGEGIYWGFMYIYIYIYTVYIYIYIYKYAIDLLGIYGDLLGTAENIGVLLCLYGFCLFFCAFIFLLMGFIFTFENVSFQKGRNVTVVFFLLGSISMD